MPKLSVLLPAHNAEATVGRAVSSTLRALPCDAELVVLDDGSTDTTVAQALRAGQCATGLDPRLRVESRPASGGITRALNWLLAHSDSDLVARMDADDISLPGRFRTTQAALARGTDVVFSQICMLNGKRIIPQAPLGISPEAFPLYLLLTNPVSHPTMVATRTSLESVGGYREVPAEDYDLWLRMATSGARMQRLAQWGLLYRLHPEQITASTSWRSASWTNPEQAEAFAQLSTRLVGQPLDRFVALTQLPAAQREPHLVLAEELLGREISQLAQPHRTLLQRKLRSRIDWARAAPCAG